MQPAYANVGSHMSTAYNYLGVPHEVTGYRKGMVPRKPKQVGKKGKVEKKKESKRAEIPKHKEKKKSIVDKSEKVRFFFITLHATMHVPLFMMQYRHLNIEVKPAFIIKD